MYCNRRICVARVGGCSKGLRCSSPIGFGNDRALFGLVLIAARGPGSSLDFPWPRSLWQRPWCSTHNFSLTISPKIHHHSNRIIDRGVRSLVQQRCGQSSKREHHESGFDGAVQCGAGEEPERPFPGKHEDAHDQVDDLQDREGLHCCVKILGEEVPEYFGPEERFQCRSHLV